MSAGRECPVPSGIPAGYGGGEAVLMLVLVLVFVLILMFVFVLGGGLPSSQAKNMKLSLGAS